MQRGFFVTAKLLVSFLLHFCPERLQLSNLFLQYSVPRICAFKDFCITRLGRLSALEDRGAKN